MKRNRHYFYFWVSVLNTSLFVLSTILFGVGFVMTALGGDTVGLVVSSILLSGAILVGFILAFFDGWAAWEIEDDRLVATKLFRRRRSIPLESVTSVQRKPLDVIFLHLTDRVEGYAISGNGVTIVIPKAVESDALVEEIRKRNGI